MSTADMAIIVIKLKVHMQIENIFNLVVRPEKYFAIPMNFLNVRKCLEEIFIQLFISQSVNLQMEETNIVDSKTGVDKY